MRSECAILFALLVLTAGISSAGAQTFAVNSLGDAANSAAGNGVCFTGNFVPPGSQPECTLRAAIQEANLAGSAVTIAFDSSIPVNALGFSIIEVATGLPFINNRVTIDGRTHPEYVSGGGARLVVRYTGDPSSTLSGIRFSSAGGGSRSTVQAIGIFGFTGSGILLNGGTGYTIDENSIGLFWRPNLVGGTGNGAHGIDVNGASASGGGNVTIIRDNLISVNDGDGIHIRDGASAMLVQNNIIGLRPRPAGGFDALNEFGNGGYGVFIASSAGSQNFIGGFGSNTISNNHSGGVMVRANGQNITGNLIGLPHEFQTAGNSALEDYGNAGVGIVLESSNNIVGGSGIATNWIGNAASVSIRIGNGSTTTPIQANNNQIRRNFIGLTPDGDDVGTTSGIRVDNGNGTIIDGATIANHGLCVRLRGTDNVATRNTVSDCVDGIQVEGSGRIGGIAGEGNHLYNNSRGVHVVDTGNQLVTIHSNWVGTDANGTDLGNGSGIQVSGPNNLVDIGRVNDGNMIGHNLIGIWLTGGATDSWAFANWIGILPDGTPVPNSRGVSINATNAQSVRNNRLGTSLVQLHQPERANVIAHNNTGVEVKVILDGIEVINNSIRGNRFFANGKGIDLGPGGNTVDPGGGAMGPNRLQNFPEINASETRLNPLNGQLQVRFRVRTDAVNADYPLLIDFYKADGQSPQGEMFVGALTYEAEAAGSWQTVTFTTASPLQAGDFIVATATDSSGNTSEFTPEPIPVILVADELFGDRFQASP